MGEIILRLVTVLVRAIVDLVIGLLTALTRGLVDLITRFFSSQFGIGMTIFAVGFFLQTQGKEGPAVLLGLLGLIIAFTSFAKKGKGK